MAKACDSRPRRHQHVARRRVAGGYSRHELDDIHANLSRLVSRGQLTNAVTAEVPFDELPGALQRIADRRVVGKIVMVP